ncbi:DsbA family protein [Streptomyces klenkii]|uniref:DsbA family protein n=1 Tax=Streptomyces klenkii TaxID=1420899 RepID=UPI00341BC8B7
MSKTRSSNRRANARERMRAEREREMQRALRRKRLGLTGGIAALLAAIVGITISIQSDKAEDARPVIPPRGATGDQDLVIATGKADAPVTIQIYEDFRCPGCAQVEKEIGKAVHKLEDEGKLRVEYHLVSVVDQIFPGNGSKFAASAAASAQDAGKFREFHDVLFASQPAKEKDDKFGDKDVLLDLASKVKGLKTPEFVESVNTGKHETWVKKIQRTFDRQTEVEQVTPTVILNGKNLVADRENLLTAERITQLVNDAAEKSKKK